MAIQQHRIRILLVQVGKFDGLLTTKANNLTILYDHCSAQHQSLGIDTMIRKCALFATPFKCWAKATFNSLSGVMVISSPVSSKYVAFAVARKFERSAALSLGSGMTKFNATDIILVKDNGVPGASSDISPTVIRRTWTESTVHVGIGISKANTQFYLWLTFSSLVNREFDHRMRTTDHMICKNIIC